ncbi:MAG: hypothetical protein HWN66_19180 [Candidatus Helarchaeota archaeon]|nr:hypothetical protein [Candidatus Helarchaeota archaeon]
MANENENSTLFDTLETSKNGSIIAHLFIPMMATLFFIQAFRAYVPGLYIAMFHVVFQDPGWIGSFFTVLTILFFIIPLFTNKLCKRFGQEKIYLISIVIVAIARLLIAAHLPSLAENILAALVVAFYGIYFSIFLKRLVQNDMGMELKAKMSIFSVTFIAAFLLDSVFRTIGYSSDISLITIHLNPALWYILQYIWLAVQVPLSLLLIWFSFRSRTEIFPEEKVEETEAMRNEPWVLNAGGFGMFFFLIFNVFLYPNAIAEYTNTEYAIINPIMTGAIILALVYLLFGKEKSIYNIEINICFNIILLLALAAVLFLGTTWPYLTASFMSLSIAVMFLNTHVLITNMRTPRKKGNLLKQFSKLMSYGVLFFILMTFLHAFTTDYAFTISAFQGLGPLILFIGGCIFTLTTLLAHMQLNKFEKGRSD